jgi:hypothetical protein
MTAIFGFIVVHVSLALLVPKTLVSMVTGGPDIAANAKAHSGMRAGAST